MLKSRSEWPPNGWQFREPKTGWQLPAGLSFEPAVTAIIKHRQQNKQYAMATDRDVVRDELDNFTCTRLNNSPHYCTPQVIPFTNPLAGRPRLSGVKGSVAGVSNWLANTTAGIKLWLDWFGDGKPVDQQTAERRAAVCVECPGNDTKKTFQEWFTGVAAKEIMAIFSALHDLNLHTSKDEQLKVCMYCDCPLKAKVWAPIGIIMKHMRKDSYDKLTRQCWIRKDYLDTI